MADFRRDITRPGHHAAPEARSFLPAPLQAIISKPALRAYLQALFSILIALALLGASVVSYWIFYYKFVPQTSLEREVHLQFGNGHPSGIAFLGGELASGQQYDVSVALHLPRTPSNLAAGNFMLDLALLPPLDDPYHRNSSTAPRHLLEASRPGILTYNSPMVDTANRLSRLPLYVFGWGREAENLRISMMEGVRFSKGKKNVPAGLRLEIQSHERMQVYRAVVRFDARFTGLRWFMYNWRILSFLVCSFGFWVVSTVVASAVWMVLSAHRDPEPKREPTAPDSDEDSNVSIKTESEDGDNDSLSSSSSGKGSGQGGVSYMPIQAEESEEEVKKEEEEQIEESTLIEPLVKDSSTEYPEETAAASTQSQFASGDDGVPAVQRRMTHIRE